LQIRDCLPLFPPHPCLGKGGDKEREGREKGGA